MKRVAKIVGGVVLWLVVLLCLTVTILPRFLDRIYYEGPRSTHFDGDRFFNPDDAGDDNRMPAGKSRGGFIWAQATGVQWGELHGGAKGSLWRWDGTRAEFAGDFGHITF